MQRRVMVAAVATSLALHVLAIVGTPRFDLAWLYETPEPPPLKVELVAPPAPAPVQQTVRTPRPAPRPRPVQRVIPAPTPLAAPDGTNLTAEPLAPAASSGVEGEVGTELAAARDAPPAERAPLAYPLRSARLVFELYYGESRTLVGEAVQTWQLEGNRYVAESVAEAVGFVSLFFGGRYVQRSEGTLGPDGFVPDSYVLQDRQRKKPERVVFDWAAGKLRFQRRGTERQAELLPGTQDPLSAVHQLYFLQPLPPGVVMNVATTRKAEQMLFQNMGEDEVMSAAGPVRAVHVKRQDLDGAITEVWLDPRRDFLPVRIYTLNRNGHIIDQLLREATIPASR